MHCVCSVLRVSCVGKGDEAEAAGFARLLIGGQIDVIDAAKLAKVLADLHVAALERKPADEDLAPITVVAAAHSESLHEEGQVTPAQILDSANSGVVYLP